MKLYQSKKKVHAEPMSNDQWERYREEVLLANGKSYSTADTKAGKMFRDGFHVVYNMDTPDEYHSWCPRQEFLAGNVVINYR